MANSWFNATGNPITRALGLSSLMRTEFAAIAAAFDRMPDPQTGAGVKGFSGGTLTSPTIATPVVQGGSIGSTASPVGLVASVATFGAGTGYAAGAIPSSGASSGPQGGFFRMAGVNQVGYANFDATTPVTSFFFDDHRALVMGDGANELATTTTDGFLYIPTVNGTPTGAPAAYTGAAPIVYDRSANKLWVRYGGTWRQTSALT